MFITWMYTLIILEGNTVFFSDMVPNLWLMIAHRLEALHANNSGATNCMIWDNIIHIYNYLWFMLKKSELYRQPAEWQTYTLFVLNCHFYQIPMGVSSNYSEKNSPVSLVDKTPSFSLLSWPPKLALHPVNCFNSHIISFLQFTCV